MHVVWRLLRDLPLLLLSPFLWLTTLAGLLLTDLFWWIAGRKRPAAKRSPRRQAVSIVIPNWNGRDLLEKYLPSVEAAIAAYPGSEILVVENASTDGSLELLRERFPRVRTLKQKVNLGFGGGSNAGFAAAKNDVVILLNSDMRVEPDFVGPLLRGFEQEDVFAVSCQIFFSDPNRRREETGLTEGWWQDGNVSVGHRDDPAITDLFPCFYAGGGSSAYDRAKFLELGGFDPIYAPFYHEDADLGYLAWKRGWKVLYQPASIVYHEHRGTIGKNFSREFIDGTVNRNFLLFCWKNIHDWKCLAEHGVFSYGGALVSLALGEQVGRASLRAWARAFLRLPQACAARWRARAFSAISDAEALHRPRGGVFHDRFSRFELAAGRRLSVVFVSPYPVCPPIHGGGVFMYQTLLELARHADVHAVILLDYEHERAAHAELLDHCRSVELLVKPGGSTHDLGSLEPHAVSEFRNRDLEWTIDRLSHDRRADVLQLEYMPLAQYGRRYRRIVTALFEHDIYFQSIRRGLGSARGAFEAVTHRFEYLRALRWELQALPAFDQVQVCTRENRDFLLTYLPEIAARVEAGLRAGIDTRRYDPSPRQREPLTMLFLGSFRHTPNRVAVEWFLQNVLPHVLEGAPGARFVMVGSDPPPAHAYGELSSAIEFQGFVDDIREPLGRYSVFVCPILAGSGVRVKLLEAYATGIPVVSTTVGAEGLIGAPGEFCLLADDPREFAAQVLRLFADEAGAREMAVRARQEVERNWDMAAITARLEQRLRDLAEEKQRGQR